MVSVFVYTPYTFVCVYVFVQLFQLISCLHLINMYVHVCECMCTTHEYSHMYATPMLYKPPEWPYQHSARACAFVFFLLPILVGIRG